MTMPATPRHAALDALLAGIEPARAALAAHGIYAALRTPAALRVFLEHHVFAVWDFMSLVKSLQATLTCTSVPWVPRGDPLLRRFVHEIVLGEESDVDARGEVASHFELYLRAMRACGADVGPISRLVDAVTRGTPVVEALELSGAPPAAAAFVRHTFAVLERGEPHAVAAAFTFGREDVIPTMFRAFVDELRVGSPAAYEDLLWYLDRHIALDADSHAPLARRLVTSLCGEDPDRWRVATDVARRSIEARVALWDGIIRAVCERSRLDAGTDAGTDTRVDVDAGAGVSARAV